MKKIDVSVILPCFNEGPTFEKSVEKILVQLKQLKKNWEIIFVEDKSIDDTKKSVESLVKKIKNSRTIYHAKNYGRGKSVEDGIRVAWGSICGYLDVDLEVSEKYIPLFIKEVEAGNDLVVGKRFYEGGLKSIVRVILSKGYAFLFKLTVDVPVDDTETGYKFFNRRKILPILKKVKSKHWFWDTEICERSYGGGLKISQIPVLFKRRTDKKSTVKIIPDTIDYISNLIKLKFRIANFKYQTNNKS